MARRPGYQRADARTRAAKAAGYPARSVYKLQEIDRRCRLFRRGARVLDLGASPGSWSLYACQQVGPSGRVLAVDLSPLGCALPPGGLSLQADVFEAESSILAQYGPYDLVLSDMAPRTTGSKLSDQTHSQQLCERALQVADAQAAPGSHFVAKLFMNPGYPQLKRAIAQRYREFRALRPEATRTQSSEVFLVGLGRNASST